MERITAIALYDGKRKEIKKAKRAKTTMDGRKDNVSFGKTKTKCKE